ncbi:hypothetical protein BGX38DRAFT_1106890 [Terfezia claveryi]|nr:hypothetical protein BGX38DRAFT_1106890 [Terfezia claveryi]
MHTGDWWWQTQLTLPVGSTLIPVILTSDQTFLTNFSGDEKLWLLFMSITNIPSYIRYKPTTQAWMLIALLPVVQHEILGRILQPLVQLYEGGGCKMVCADEKVRKCIPMVSSWLADHMENVNIHSIKTNRCPICTATPCELGTLPKRPYAVRNHIDYQRLFKAGDVDRYGHRKPCIVVYDS